jgi:hypothetical protein
MSSMVSMFGDGKVSKERKGKDGVKTALMKIALGLYTLHAAKSRALAITFNHSTKKKTRDEWKRLPAKPKQSPSQTPSPPPYSPHASLPPLYTTSPKPPTHRLLYARQRPGPSSLPLQDLPLVLLNDMRTQRSSRVRNEVPTRDRKRTFAKGLGR